MLAFFTLAFAFDQGRRLRRIARRSMSARTEEGARAQSQCWSCCGGLYGGEHTGYTKYIYSTGYMKSLTSRSTGYLKSLHVMERTGYMQSLALRAMLRMKSLTLALGFAFELAVGLTIVDTELTFTATIVLTLGLCVLLAPLAIYANHAMAPLQEEVHELFKQVEGLSTSELKGRQLSTLEV
jgi:hypothetical protein